MFGKIGRNVIEGADVALREDHAAKSIAMHKFSQARSKAVKEAINHSEAADQALTQFANSRTKMTKAQQAAIRAAGKGSLVSMQS